MKLSQYDPQINRNILQGRVQAVDNRAAWGGDQSGQAALGQAMGNVSVALNQQWMKDQNDRVFDALNEYEQQKNTVLYDEKNGLFNTMQGKNAEGLQAAFQAQESKIRQDIIAKYKLGSNYAMSAFRKQVEPSYTSTLRSIDGRQRSELEKYTANQDTIDFDNTVNQMVSDPSNTGALAVSYLQRATARVAGLGQDEAAQEVYRKGQVNKMADKTLAVAVENNDYENGISNLAYFKSAGADAAVLNKFDNAFRKQKNVKMAANDIKLAMAKYPDLVYMTDDELENVFDAVHPYSQISGDIGNAIVDFVKSNYKEGEQWMGKVTKDPTIQCDSWTADAYARMNLFPDGEITRAADFGSAYHKNGDGYEPKPGDFIDGVKHVGIYLGNGMYMARNSSGGVHTGTMEEWNEWFGEPLGYGSVSEVGGSTSPEVAEARRKDLLSEFMNAVKKERHTVDQRNAQAVETMRNTIVSMKQAGSTNQDIFNYLSNMQDMNPGLSRYTAFNVLKNQYAGGGGSGSGAGSTEGKIAARNIEAMIENGTIQNANDFRYAIENAKGISMEQYEKLNKYFNDTISGKGIDIDISKDDMSKRLYGRSGSIGSMEWGSALVIAKQQAAQFAAENKREATQEEKANMVEKALLKGTDIGKNEYSAAELRAKGIAGIAPAGNGYYRIIWTDGDWNDVFEDQTAELVQGKITRQDL